VAGENNDVEEAVVVVVDEGAALAGDSRR